MFSMTISNTDIKAF